jgi:hypothetical protein
MKSARKGTTGREGKEVKILFWEETCGRHKKDQYVRRSSQNEEVIFP